LLGVEEPGYLPWRQVLEDHGPVQIELEPDQRSIELDLDLEVVDSLGGPILTPEVAYTLCSLGPRTDRERWLAVDWTSVWAPAGHWRTNLQVPEQGTWMELRIRVRAAGYQAGEALVPVEVHGPRSIAARVTLLVGASCSGWVYDEEGPVPDAKVCVLDRSGRPLQCGQSTAPDGAFALEPFALAEADGLWAWAKGRKPQTMTRKQWLSAPLELVVELQSGATLRGTLRSATGLAQANQNLRLTLGIGSRALDPFPMGMVLARTDDQGRFQFDGLPPGTWPVDWLGDVGEFPQTRWLGDLRVGLELDGTQDLVLPQGVALRGEVRLPPELIDSLVEIQVWKADRSSAQGTRPLARWVGTPGRFQIERLPVGEVLVRLLESEEVQAEQRFWLDRDHAELPTFDFGSWSAYEAWLAGVQPR